MRASMFALAIIASLTLSAAHAEDWPKVGTISTFAGTGVAGYGGDGSAATTGMLNGPTGVVIDSTGNIYISDSLNRRIRKVDASTGVITTIAGGNMSSEFCGDGGPATAACLGEPLGIALSGVNTLLFVDHLRVRRIDLTTHIITTVVGNESQSSTGDGGPATAASLAYPHDVAADAAGNLLISEYGGTKIRRVDAVTGIITTVAGTGTVGSSGDGGPATSAQLTVPKSVAVDGEGNVYIGDARWQFVNASSLRLRKVSATTGIISSIAGTGVCTFSGENGPALTASVNDVTSLVLDQAGNIYLVDGARVRKISKATGIITTVAGNGDVNTGFNTTVPVVDGAAATAARVKPDGIAVDNAGNLYFSQEYQIRKAEAPRVDPGTLTLMRYGATGVLLNWTSSTGSTGYVVKRGTASGAETPLVTVPSNAAYITGSPNSRYFFSVTAQYGFDETASTNEVSVVLTAAAARTDTRTGTEDPTFSSIGRQQVIGSRATRVPGSILLPVGWR